VLCAIVFVSSKAQAADIARDVGAATGSMDNSDGGYFEFGVGLGFFGKEGQLKLKRAFILSGAYRYRGVFFEAFNPSIGVSKSRVEVGGISLGVNLWCNDQWAVDLLAANTKSRFRSYQPDRGESNTVDSEREEAVLERDTFYSGTGIRLTGFFGKTLFQFRLVDDTHGGNGVTSSASVSYSHQVKNWNFHTLLSANYLSRTTGQHWYGVSGEEASQRYPRYNMPSSTTSFVGEIGATYPLRENLVFRSTLEFQNLADEIVDSPLQDSSFGIGWRTTVSYVF